MELDELKKVWDQQNENNMYVLDDRALNGMIANKKKRAINKAKWMEWILTAANLVAGSLLIIVHTHKKSEDIYAFIMGATMILTGIIILYFRNQRLSNSNQFDRSVSGDLEHGLSDALYVVRMSRTMQIYFMAIAILMILSIGFDNIITAILMIFFVGFTLYASTWEHKWYVKKYEELKKLKSILEND